VLAAIMVVTMVAAPWIVRLYTLRVTGPEAEAERELATFLLRWFMPQIVFYGVGAVAIGLLNAHRRFAVPMFAPILNNLIVVATFVTFAAISGTDPRTPGNITTAQRYVLAIGTTFGVVAMTAVLWPAMRTIGFRFRWRLRWRDEAVVRIARLALWTFVYVMVNQLGLFVVIVLAGGDSGGYTAYTAAFILFQLPHAIFAVSIFTALVPAMSSRWSERDITGFRAFLAQGIRATAFILIPAALGYLALATPIVRLLLQHGQTGPKDTRLIAGILTLFAVGLFSFSTFQLLLRAFYSMQDTRTPALINVAAVALNTGVNFLYFFAFDLGVKGLALGSATAYTFASIVAVAVIRKRLGGIEGRRILSGIGRTLVAATATAATAWLAGRLIGRALGTAGLLTQAIQVVGAVGAGLLVFAALALILRIEEVDVVRGALIARFRR
jgi:putative peptidoglycan lipid II flippase